jgi:tRNA(Arg) A34 adenosine deaminase TadA
MSADDQRFMRLALDEATQGDYPFGTVIARDGQVIARGRNLGKANGDPTAHGEMVAIRRCLADHGSAALRGSTLYTSGEPCAMCMGAILWSYTGGWFSRCSYWPPRSIRSWSHAPTSPRMRRSRRSRSRPRAGRRSD